MEKTNDKPNAAIKTRLFVDMDGVLAVFKPTNTLEVLYEEGYFKNLEPMPDMIQAVKEIIRGEPEIEVYILSAHLSDSPYALDEKNQWLDRYLPEIPPGRRIFPACGEDKKAHIPGGVRGADCLLDDYTKNLSLWQPPGKGIKLLNGINHTRGTWEHDRIWHKKSPQDLARDIADVAKGRRQVLDNMVDLRPMQASAPIKKRQNVR